MERTSLFSMKKMNDNKCLERQVLNAWSGKC